MTSQIISDIAKDYADAIVYHDSDYIIEHMDEIDQAKSQMSKREWWDMVNSFMAQSI